MLQTEVAEKIKTHILCWITFFRESCRLWDNNAGGGEVADPERSQKTTRRMRFACRITKATDAHLEYELFIAFLRQQWLHERGPMLCYPYTSCLVKTSLAVCSTWSRIHKTKLGRSSSAHVATRSKSQVWWSLKSSEHEAPTHYCP